MNQTQNKKIKKEQQPIKRNIGTSPSEKQNKLPKTKNTPLTIYLQKENNKNYPNLKLFSTDQNKHSLKKTEQSKHCPTINSNTNRTSTQTRNTNEEIRNQNISELSFKSPPLITNNKFSLLQTTPDL